MTEDNAIQHQVRLWNPITRVIAVALTLPACSWFAKPTTDIQGFLCRSTAQMYENGSLKSFELAQDEVLQGHLIPAGSRVFLDPNGILEGSWLARDMVYDGIPCRGGFAKVHTGFHPNGRVKTAFLSRDTVIQGVPCEASLMVPVRFTADGLLLPEN